MNKANLTRPSTNKFRSPLFGVIPFATLVWGCGSPTSNDWGEEQPLAEEPAAATEPLLLGGNEYADEHNCSQQQISQIQSAEDLAYPLVNEAMDWLAALYLATDLPDVGSASDATFESNFGPLTEATWSEVYDRYSGVLMSMDTAIYSCHVDGDVVGRDTAGDIVCGEAGGLLAVTTKTNSSVRLCPPFFAEPTYGRAVTVVHEVSHQNRTYSAFGGIGTSDINQPVPNSAHKLGLFLLKFGCTPGSSGCLTLP